MGGSRRHGWGNWQLQGWGRGVRDAEGADTDVAIDVVASTA